MFKSTLSASVDEGFTVGIGACVRVCEREREFGSVYML